MPGRRLAAYYGYRNYEPMHKEKEGNFFATRILKGRPPVIGGSVDDWNVYIAYLVRLSQQKQAARYQAAIALALRLAEDYAHAAKYSAAVREGVQAELHKVLPISEYVEPAFLRRSVVRSKVQRPLNYITGLRRSRGVELPPPPLASGGAITIITNEERRAAEEERRRERESAGLQEQRWRLQKLIGQQPPWASKYLDRLHFLDGRRKR